MYICVTTLLLTFVFFYILRFMFYVSCSGVIMLITLFRCFPVVSDLKRWGGIMRVTHISEARLRDIDLDIPMYYDDEC